MNTKRLIAKLQRALCKCGRVIKINQFQNYSERFGRMTTKYVVAETQTGEDGKKRLVTIAETYSAVDVVKTLAAIYGDAHDTKTESVR